MDVDRPFLRKSNISNKVGSLITAAWYSIYNWLIFSNAYKCNFLVLIEIHLVEDVLDALVESDLHFGLCERLNKQCTHRLAGHDDPGLYQTMHGGLEFHDGKVTHSVLVDQFVGYFCLLHLVAVGDLIEVEHELLELNLISMWE